jgi:hypothetical protein
MSNKPRVAERDRTLMIPIADMGGQVAVSTNALFVGPGEPGPEDDWQIPPESLDGTPSETIATTEAAQPTQDKPHRRGREGQ